MSDAAQKIEALLFALGRPLSHDELKKQLNLTDAALAEALDGLSRAESRGIAVVSDGREVELRTAPSAAETVERVRKEEYARDIGKAGLEALSAILYRGPLSRAEIDFIRGVNSSQTLRTLTMRGLVRRVPNPKDERSFLYEPTTEVLAQLGVRQVGELPEYASVRAKLSGLEESYRRAEQQKEAGDDATQTSA
jgi:segregation and condensation protein B